MIREAKDSQADAAKGEHWFEILEPINTLMPKVSTGGGMTPWEMLARAQAAVEALHDDFADALRQAVEELTQLHARLDAGHGNVDATLQRLFRTAHEVKGQGKTFGFDLASSIAECLCCLLDRVDPGHPKLARAVGTHIDALKLVSGRQIQGDGGEMGAELVRSLWEEVKIVGGAPRPPPKLSRGNRNGLFIDH